MKKSLALVAVVLAFGLGTVLDAEAKRLGGSRSSGMQRQSVDAPATPAAPRGNQAAPSQAAPAAGAAATAAAAPAKRSWMGPLAGIAAGLGIAALASHFGFGEALANMLTIALLAMVVMAVIGFFLRKRMQGNTPAAVGAGAGAAVFRQQQPQQPAPLGAGGSLIGSRIGGGLAPAAAQSHGNIPAGFDVPAFERNARDQFMALQAANDAGDLDRLRDYLAPELFEIARADLAERGGAAQRTEVFGLQAQVLDVAEEPGRYVVSVRFTGSVRDQAGAEPEDLREVWHLTKPSTGFGGWVVAGIQQA